MRIHCCILLWSFGVFLGCTAQEQCTESAACYPPLGDLTLNRTINTSSSCADGEEFYITGEDFSTMCDSSYHSTSSINDDDINTMWVSGINATSPISQSNPFVIELDFHSTFFYFHNMTVLWVGTPTAVTLERNNGTHWLPYMHYADNCMESFGLPDSGDVTEEIYSEVVHCTSAQQNDTKMTFQVSTSETLSSYADYQIVTGIRLVITEFDEMLSEVVSIVEWTALGTCVCNGHASECSPAEEEIEHPGKVYAGCLCSHNTAGTNCEQCESGYNNRTWIAGDEENANECQACGCNPAGIINDGDCINGVCNCKDSVTSDKCDQCRSGYWNFSTNGCQICDCGDGAESCDADSGVCVCSSSMVEGNRCDSCQEGKFNLQDGCNQDCQCDPIGSLNMLCDPNTGQCNCIDNIEGVLCNEVSEGFYYKLLDDITLEAEDTDTDLVVVTPSTNLDAFSGRGYLLIPLSEYTVVFTAEVDTSSQYLIVIRYKSSADVTGLSITINGLNSSMLILSQSETSEPSENDFSDSVPFSVRLEENVKYEIMLTYSPTQESVTEWMLDSIVLVPDISNNSDYYATLGAIEKALVWPCFLSLPVQNGLFCQREMFRFSIEFNGQVFPCEDPNPNGILNSNEVCNSYGGHYSCISNYTDRLCEQCTNGYYYNNISGLCELCMYDCDANGAFNVACDQDTGDCQCRDNVENDRCDTCSEGYYDLTNGCVECSCSQYATSISCNDTTGACDCPDNVEGLKCDECKDTYYNISRNGCVSCGCNLIACESAVCNKTTGQCACTGNAIGLQCTDCPDTYYQTNSTITGQDYCTECFCFNQTTNCVGDTSDVYVLTSVHNDFGISCAGSCGQGWTSHNMELELTFSTIDGLQYFIPDPDMPPIFLSPEEYHGDFRLAYGHSLNLVFVVGNQGLVSQDAIKSNYVRLSNSITTLYSLYPSATIIGEEYSFIIPLHESYWRVDSTDGDTATLDELINVLANITELEFTGRFQMNSIFEFNHLKFVQLEYLSLATSLDSDQSFFPFTAEICNCPSGHRAPFCDECTNGYYREVNSLLASCIECNCNGRSETCNADGVCDNCTQGYRGDHCEMCSNGYYNSSYGDCVPCGCVNDNVDTSVDPFCDPNTGECLACVSNTQGFNCDVCSNGYYGNVLNNEICKVCDCVVDGAAPEICDNITGTCICKDANAVSNCSECVAGYYGNLTNNEPCTRCPCPTADNSHAASCSVVGNSLTCVCDVGYSGDDCDECDDGYFGTPLSGNCSKCLCSGNLDVSLGSTCDKVTGYCMNCTNHSFGANCENCDSGYFGDPIINIPCIPCDHCNTNGTVAHVCEMRYGDCLCRPNVVGPYCTECRDGMYGAPGLLIECQDCPCENIPNPICHLNTSDPLNATCDNCGPMYAGPHCEFCANGYYRNQLDNTCIACECNGNVDLASSELICDPDNGTCMNCLNNSRGSNCEQCTPGYYGDIPNGVPCTRCNCSRDGATEDICDPNNGTCFCLPNINNPVCSDCVAGFYGFSDGCEPCDCCTNGSISTSCTQNGECFCKDGVEGTKCCQCASGYYNLTDEGCTACGCNELMSLSKDCNSTGHCECKEGVSGIKCDVCGDIFGFMMTESGCSVCHDCFFSWNDILTNLNSNISQLMNKVQVILDYYDGFNVNSVENIVKSIENSIITANQMLQSVSVDTTLLKSINTTIGEVTLFYAEFEKEEIILRNIMTQTNQILNNVTMFLSTYESYESDTNNISGIISDFSAIIQSLQAQASRDSETIRKNYIEIQAIKATVDLLWMNVTLAESGLQLAENGSNYSLDLLQMAKSLATETSEVDALLMQNEKSFNIFEKNLIEQTLDVDEVVMELSMLDQALSALNHRLLSVSQVSGVLENSTLAVKQQAESILEDIKNVILSSNEALVAAESLMNQISTTQDHSSIVASNLTTAKDQATNLDQLQTPSIAKATDIATGINDTIVPEEQVREVLRDANETVTKAQELSDRATNANQKVNNLEDLEMSVHSDLAAVNSTLDKVAESFTDISEDSAGIGNNLEEVDRHLSTAVNKTDSLLANLDHTEAVLKQSESTLNQLKNTVEDGEADSELISKEITDSKNEAESEAAVLNQLKIDATVKRDISTQKAKRATTAKDSSDQSKSDSDQPPNLQELANLLTQYKSRLKEINTARARLTEYNKQLEGLASSFNEATTKYKKCYKTP